MDWIVLRQLDWSQYAPALIHLEIVNLPAEELQACTQELQKQGYRRTRHKYDLTAVRERSK